MKNLFLFVKCKNILVLILILFLSAPLFGLDNTADLTNKEKLELYKKEKIIFEVKEQFDVLYPKNINVFYFKKGNENISFKEFMELTNDPILQKRKDKIKKIKIGGFTTVGCFGASTIGFLIPSIIFIANQTNFNSIDSTFIISGVVTVVLAGVSLAGMITALVVTFSLLHKYKYGVPSIKNAVERYNEKLMKELGIQPDISFYNNNVNFFVGIKL